MKFPKGWGAFQTSDLKIQYAKRKKKEKTWGAILVNSKYFLVLLLC